MKPIVKILVSCPNPEWFDACTWVLPTLRTGFPTAQIDIDVNAHVTFSKLTPMLATKFSKIQSPADSGELDMNISVNYRQQEIHHADWIREKIEQHDSEAPLVILDADTYFHKKVEDWCFSTLVAGYGVPQMWNDFAKCPSVGRIHTSFMWFSNVPALRKALADIYPPGFDKTAAYSPCDPYMPCVRFFCGKPMFWDTCANMHHMLAGAWPMTYFGPDQKECFDHLNSAAFFDVMKERLPDGATFEHLHRNLIKNPEALRGILWRTTDQYYQTKRAQLFS